METRHDCACVPMAGSLAALSRRRVRSHRGVAAKTSSPDVALRPFDIRSRSASTVDEQSQFSDFCRFSGFVLVMQTTVRFSINQSLSFISHSQVKTSQTSSETFLPWRRHPELILLTIYVRYYSSVSRTAIDTPVYWSGSGRCNCAATMNGDDI